MNKKLLFFIFVFLAVLLEATILNYFRLFSVRPNLILCLLALASLYLEVKWSLGLAIFSGILKDVFGGQFFGINTLLFVFWSFAIIRLSKKISLDNDFIRAALIFILVIAHDIATALMLLALNKSVVSWGIFLRITFLESLYTLVIFPWLFKMMKPALSEI